MPYESFNSRCPDCGSQLEAKSLGIGVSYVCGGCGGAAVGVNALKNRNALKSFVDSIWQKAKNSPVIGQKACPFCLQLMVEVKEDTGDRTLELDICSKCMMIWFDKGEQDKFPKIYNDKDLSFAKTDDLSPELREALAVYELKEIKRQEKEIEEGLPDSFWKSALAILGFPVKSDQNAVESRTVVVWYLSILIIALNLIGHLHGYKLIEGWGMIPDQWARNFGITLISSFFVHGGFEHVLYNLYFFIVFGRNVEEILGPWRFLLLLFLSHLTGIFFHFVINPGSNIPVVGASAGISGVLAYYAFVLPKDKISIAGIIFLRLITLKISVWLVFSIHFAIQLIGAVNQFIYGTSISYIAHLGGIFAGIGMALWIRESENSKNDKEAGYGCTEPKQ